MSQFAPYKSFEEWSIEYEREECGAEFEQRCNTMREALERWATEYPGDKFTTAEIARLHNEKFCTPETPKRQRMTGPKVQTAMRELRLQGYPINSDADGFWWSLHPEDLRNTINHLIDREHGIRYAREKLQTLLAKILATEVEEGRP